MKPSFCYLVALSFCLSTCWMACFSDFVTDADAPKSIPYQPTLPIDTTCPIAYNALLLEQSVGMDVEATEFVWLDMFVDAVKRHIPPKTNYTKAEALAILNSIQRTLENWRDKQLSYHPSLHLSLRYKQFDCDINSLLFLTVAQQLDLPIYGIALPNHMIITWKDTQTTIYWETIEGKEKSLGFYQQKYPLALDSTLLSRNFLFKPLHQKELVALLWFNIGQSYVNIQQLPYAVKYMRTAMDIAPNWFQPYYSLAHLCLRTEEYELALYYAHQAKRWLPTLIEMYKIKAKAYEALGCDTEAIEMWQLFVENG